MKFSIDSLLSDFNASSPRTDTRPVIGITANHKGIDMNLREKYYEMVVKAGGVPVIIPPVKDANIIADTLQRIDGLLLSGGADFNPLWCDEQPLPGLHNVNAKRDAAELMITRLASYRHIPMLGICRGMQTLAMALGGHVCQDFKSDQVKHSQDADREEPTHTVTLTPDSILASLFKEETLAVNSFHHQAVDNTGERFRVTALAADGCIEAMESTEMEDIIGVQWHPEWMEEDGMPLFAWLVEKAAEHQRVSSIHSRITTLDTHCDTPMFFPKGVDFTQRDERILVDLHKMNDGLLDATTMVSYLPQPQEGETFEGNEGVTPRQFADNIFDTIERSIAKAPHNVALARNANDIIANKKAGRKSILLGIENGLAIENDLRNLQHFADRGITYMTLCHNGDNQICDSARGSQTHGGVSEFGEKVIRELNSHGILVDLSHAAESSFYDAIQISSQPIVCSHSNCRALCDHPRNLTDDQLRALAKNDGLVHITFYHGFLNNVTEPTILDGIKHLEHAISIVGIDHVGIGTDFDGDGGVRGMYDATCARQFTLQLLRRRYSEQDIACIWGGNWMLRLNRETL